MNVFIIDIIMNLHLKYSFSATALRPGDLAGKYFFAEHH